MQDQQEEHQEIEAPEDQAAEKQPQAMAWVNPWADNTIQAGGAAPSPFIPMPHMQLPPSSYYNQQSSAQEAAQTPNPYQQPQNAGGNRFTNKEEFLAYNTGYNEGYVQGYYCGMNNMAIQQQQRRNYYYNKNRGRGGRGRGNYRGNGQRRHYYHNRTHFPGETPTTTTSSSSSSSETQAETEE